MHLAKIEGNPLQPNLGDLHASEESYGKAGTILDGLIAADPDNPALQQRVAEYAAGYGGLLANTDRVPAAVVQYRRGLAATQTILSSRSRESRSAKTLRATACAVGQGERTRRKA